MTLRPTILRAALHAAVDAALDVIEAANDNRAPAKRPAYRPPPAETPLSDIDRAKIDRELRARGIPTLTRKSPP